MLTLIALAIVIAALISIRATVRLVAIIITITTIVVLGTANAHAAPGLGACGECTSNVVGLSIDYLGALVLFVLASIGTAYAVYKHKANQVATNVYADATATVVLKQDQLHLAILELESLAQCAVQDIAYDNIINVDYNSLVDGVDINALETMLKGKLVHSKVYYASTTGKAVSISLFIKG